MDSKASSTNLVEVVCLEDQQEVPQVVTPRKLITIRGFFIMVAALSLTIFIGLVIVLVINDINDKPRRNGYYGHSPDVARHGGCRFHVMSFGWLSPDCRNEEPAEEFRNFGPGDWFTDADLNEASDEPCDMEEVPAGVEGRL